MTDNNNKKPFNEDNYTHNINRNMERELDRRGFMKTMVGAAGLFAVSTLPWGTVAAKELMGLGNKAYPHQRITDINSIAVGEAVEFNYPAEHDGALLIRIAENKFVAYQNACTHLKIPVILKNETNELIISLQNGAYYLYK